MCDRKVGRGLGWLRRTTVLDCGNRCHGQIGDVGWVVVFAGLGDSVMVEICL